MASLENVLDWRGREMVDSDGAKIGKIEEIYVDQQTDEPEWALVNTGLFAGKSTFVPLGEATEGRDDVRVPFPKDHIKDAPRMDPSGELTRDEEAELYRHYEMDYGRSESDSGLPEGRPSPEATERTRDPDLRDRAEARGTDPSLREQAGGERRDDRDVDDREVDARDADERESRTRAAGGGHESGERLRVADERGAPTRPRLRRYVVTEVVTASGAQEVEREEVSEVELPSEGEQRR